MQLFPRFNKFLRREFWFNLFTIKFKIIALKAQFYFLDNFGNWKPFKSDEKGFLFHLKSSFRSQDI